MTAAPQSINAPSQAAGAAPQSMVEAVLEAAAGGDSDTETEQADASAHKQEQGKHGRGAAPADSSAADVIQRQKELAAYETVPGGNSGEGETTGKNKKNQPKKPLA
jgi:hypothetical protein